MSEQFIPVCEPLLAGNEHKYVQEAMQTGWISSSGKYVSAFEEAFAEYCGLKHAVAVCNGTVALHLALAALKIGPGDEVIIPSFTMIATAMAVCYTGAMPVFIDADPQTWNIDTSLIEEQITDKTRAIIPVHIMGLPCDMDALRNIADGYKLTLLVDAAEAHGAEWKGEKSGGLGDIAAFSFFGNKNLTTGEGGMVITDDSDLYDRARYLKNLAFPLQSAREYIHDEIGFNYRMSNLHAAIGLAQTERADYYRDLRIRNHGLYRQGLSDIPGIKHQFDPSYDSRQAAQSNHVHWMNAVVIDSNEYGRTRDELMDLLRDRNIDSRKLFTGMHRQKSLYDYGCNCSGAYPVTDLLADNGLYLPSGSGLTSEDISYICETIRRGHR